MNTIYTHNPTIGNASHTVGLTIGVGALTSHAVGLTSGVGALTSHAVNIPKKI